MIANLQYAWTLFGIPMREGNNWTPAEVQWAFTLALFAAALAMGLRAKGGPVSQMVTTVPSGTT